MDSIEIPIKETTQVIEVPITDLPETCDEICDVLESEQAPLDFYLRFAKIYFLHQNRPAYQQLLEKALQANDANTDQRALVTVLTHLGSLYIWNAVSVGKDRKKCADLLEDATLKFNEADRLDSLDENTLLGKGILLMVKRNFDAAIYHLNLVLEKDPVNFTALNALGAICYERKEYKEALNYWRKVLKIFQFVPYFLRLGIALCLFQLKRYDEAEFAFKATLETNVKCIEAYIYLSQIERVKGTLTSFEKSIQYVKEGLEHSQKNSVLLYELASHFFYLGDFVRCHALCYEAYCNSESDECKAKCSFLLGRNFHSNSNFDEAFQYYFQAVKLESSLSCALLGLAQCYVFRGEIALAIESLEKVLSTSPTQYEALKMISVIAHNYPKETARLSKWVESLVQLYPNDLKG